MDLAFWAINQVRDAPLWDNHLWGENREENRLSHVITQKAVSLNFSRIGLVKSQCRFITVVVNGTTREGVSVKFLFYYVSSVSTVEHTNIVIVL